MGRGRRNSAQQSWNLPRPPWEGHLFSAARKTEHSAMGQFLGGVQSKAPRTPDVHLVRSPSRMEENGLQEEIKLQNVK